ncbi:MAG: hypothetical protein AAFY15_01345, partial [Cyanobacteria bacterium J06648_11]
LAQLGPVVLDLQSQFASLEEKENPEIAALHQQLATLETTLTALADRQTVVENADAIAHLQTQLNILPDPSANIRELQLRLESNDSDRDRIQQAIATLQTQLERKADLATIPNHADELAALTERVESLATTSTQTSARVNELQEVSEAIAAWKAEFGDRLSPAEMLAALDFLGQKITQYEAELARIDTHAHADVDEAIATLRTELSRLPSLTDGLTELRSQQTKTATTTHDLTQANVELRARQDDSARSQADLEQAIATCRTDIATLADWKQQFGDHLSPAEMLEALDLLGKMMTQSESDIASKPDRAELQSLADEVSARSSYMSELQTQQAEISQAIAHCQTEVSSLALWKQQFGDQLSPAEMLEALDFLGQTITRYEPQLARKADAEAVKLNTETLVGLQDMLSELREHLLRSETSSGQTEIAIATLTQKLATADRTNEHQAKELQTQAGEIDRLNAQLVQVQAELAPEQLRQSLEKTGWSPERIAKVAKHMQSIAQAQATMRRWSIAIGCAALGAISLAASSFFGLSLG